MTLSGPTTGGNGGRAKQAIGAIGRQFATWLFHCLNTPGDPQPSRAWRGVAWLWRRLRGQWRQWRPPPERIVVVLDQPVRLRGCSAITGWAISRTSPITRVEAFVEGQLLAAGPPVEHRADVAARWPRFCSRGLNAFRIAPVIDALPDGRHTLRLRVTDAEGHTAEILTTLEVREYQVPDRDRLPAHLRGANREYQYWLEHQESVRHALARSALSPIGMKASGIPISVIMPVYRPRLDYLRAAIESVRAQSHQRWELCLCDDGTNDASLTDFLRSLQAADDRIRCTSHPGNRGIAAATNSAIKLATGDYLAFVDQDDLLELDALTEVAHNLDERPADLLYTDEDRLDEHGCRVEPILKPDWSPDLLLSRMYLGHLCVYRRAFLLQMELCRSAFDGTQDYDLALRATERSARVAHIPRILYHWRIGGNSAGSKFNRLCHERGRRALAERLARQAIAARVDDGPSACTFQVRYRHPCQPLVSILIPTRDNPALLSRCLRSIHRKTNYPHYEIVILDNGSRNPQTLQFLKNCGERVLRCQMPFNHSRLNNLAAALARGELLLLLNDDTEVITRDWLAAMVEQALRPEIGAVGAWLFHPDGRTQHAGIIVGLGPVATPLHSGILRDGIDRGTVGLIRDVTAVTGACLLTDRELYLNLGGLDEESLPTSFNDVDYCLRLRRAGYRIVQTPLARLYHHESASRVIGNEDRFVQIMHRRWGDALQYDPFWNANLPHGDNADPCMTFHWTRHGHATLVPKEAGETSNDLPQRVAA